EINAVLSGSKLDFRVKAIQLRDPKVNFGLTADKLDFNTLFPAAAAKPAPAPAPPPKGGKPAEQSAPAKAPPAPKPPPAPPREAIDLTFLDSVDVSGTVAIGELTVKDVQASQFAASLSAAGGKLSIDGI